MLHYAIGALTEAEHTSFKARVASKFGEAWDASPNFDRCQAWFEACFGFSIDCDLGRMMWELLNN